MQVVFLTHNYPRFAGDVAGAFLHPLALALAGRGHDVRVVAPSDGGRGGSDLIDGIPVTRVRYAAPQRERYAYSGRMEEAAQSLSGIWAMVGMISGMRRGARDAAAGRQTVVHAHWWFPAGLAAPPESPCVVTLHGTDARILERPGAAWLAGRALRSGRVVTAVSSAIGTDVERRTGRAVSAEHLCPMPIALGTHRSAGGGGLVFVGRLTAQKRVAIALEAHARLVKNDPMLPFTIIGDGPERSALEALARRLGTTDRVIFTGLIDPAAVAATIGHADVFLFPAEREGFGLAAVEALGAGVPVIACRDGGGVLDILREPGAGVIVDPDPTKMAVAAGILRADPMARDAAWRAGQTWRARLEPDAVAARCEGWYREALGG